MTFLELLQISDSAIAVSGGAIGLLFFMWRWRENEISSLRRDLGIPWTNEGDIHSTETNPIHLHLELTNGDLYGSLSSPSTSKNYDVHVTPCWFSAHANITFLEGRELIPIATVKLTLKGNRNRLHWTLKTMTENAPSFLPQKTVLFPF